MVIAYTSLQFPFDAKPENRSAAESEFDRYLFNRQPSGLKQSFFQALDLGRIADPFDALGTEGVAGAGVHLLFIENAGNLGIGLFVQESVDLAPHGFMRSAQLLRRQGAR